jgi:hypothetical protein
VALGKDVRQQPRHTRFRGVQVYKYLSSRDLAAVDRRRWFKGRTRGLEKRGFPSRCLCLALRATACAVSERGDWRCCGTLTLPIISRHLNCKKAVGGLLALHSVHYLFGRS